MTYTRKQLPAYCRHKPSDRAFVRIGGKMHYLGKYDSQASRQEYDRLIAEFIANGRQAVYSSEEILIEQLIVRFLMYIDRERNYSTGAKKTIQRVLQMLNDFYGKQPVTLFGPTSLKSIRRRFIESGLARGTINDYVSIIRQIFYWGCEEEIVPAEIAGALRMVPLLKYGATSAPDYDAIQPVSDEVLEKTLPYIPQQYRDMAMVQRRISGRPQDVYNMRLCDIDRSGEIWRYAPFTHKTKHKGKTRVLPIGPRAQQILLPYLEKCKDDPAQFVFPRPKTKYYAQRYANTIETACKKAGVPKWTPNQLRHAGGTEVRDKFGLEYAQAVLGHANAATTEIYAKASFDKAAMVAKEIG